MLDTKTPRKVKRKPKTKIKKYELVWAYLVAHPLATPAQVAKATKVSYAYAYALKKKISTPKEVFEAEAVANRLIDPPNTNGGASLLARLMAKLRSFWSKL